jgi:hypothetical protein
MTTAEPLWSHQQTADFLGIPAATLYQMNHKRTGPRSYKVGKHRRYHPGGRPRVAHDPFVGPAWRVAVPRGTLVISGSER